MCRGVSPIANRNSPGFATSTMRDKEHCNARFPFRHVRVRRRLGLVDVGASVSPREGESGPPALPRSAVRRPPPPKIPHPGFEPELNDPESFVLPLHQRGALCVDTLATRLPQASTPSIQTPQDAVTFTRFTPPATAGQEVPGKSFRAAALSASRRGLVQRSIQSLAGRGWLYQWPVASRPETHTPFLFQSMWARTSAAA